MPTTKNKEADYSIEELVNHIKEKTDIKDIFIILSMILWFNILYTNCFFVLKQETLDAVFTTFCVLIFPFGVLLIFRYIFAEMIVNNKKLSLFSKSLRMSVLFFISFIVTFLVTIISLGFHNVIIFELGIFDAFRKENQMGFPQQDSINIILVLISTIVVPFLIINLKGLVETKKQ
jgi:hypothetical protein